MFQKNGLRGPKKRRSFIVQVCTLWVYFPGMLNNTSAYMNACCSSNLISLFLLLKKLSATMNTCFLARVYLFGATLTSWQVEGTELIFVSPKAVFDNKKAIRWVSRNVYISSIKRLSLSDEFLVFITRVADRYRTAPHYLWKQDTDPRQGKNLDPDPH